MKKEIKKRDWNIVAIVRGEINARPKVVKSKKNLFAQSET